MTPLARPLAFLALSGAALAQGGPYRLREPEPAGGFHPRAIQVRKFVDGIPKPTDLRQAPGDSQRFFVTSGRKGIYVIKNGVVLPQLFLDLSSVLHVTQGFASLAFHPDYAANGRFFVLYMDLDLQTHLVEYSVSADPDKADPNSAVHLLPPFQQPSHLHNWDCLQFGPDGMLYVSMGDGSFTNDAVQNYAQDLGSILGKILRLDVDAAPPFIPPDNPFVGVPGAREEIWHYGLRQPWRFCFDPLTGDMFIADVGLTAREELNLVPAGSPPGLNFGWRCSEGTDCRNFPACNPMCDDPSWVDPIYEFPHDEFRCCIIGGYVYRGSAIPDLQGAYLFSDYCTSRIFALRHDGAAMTELVEWTDELEYVDGTLDLVCSYGVDHEGEIYLLDFADGEIFKLEPAPPCIATSYCEGAPNSAGPGGRIRVNDQLSVATNQFELSADGCPPNQLGIFLVGPTQNSAPFGNGTLCIGGLSRILPAAHLDGAGTTAYAVDLTDPGPNVAPVLPGTSLNFQLWYRDPAGGGALFNGTDAVHVGFCP